MMWSESESPRRTRSLHHCRLLRRLSRGTLNSVFFMSSLAMSEPYAGIESSESGCRSRKIRANVVVAIG